jgi:16S rRNA processing protein RimM
LPPADPDEYYLTDLIGLTATDQAGRTIGTVAVVHDYGAGASLEIVTQGTSRSADEASGAPVIVPFTAACVPTVDIAAGRLVVALPDEIIVAPDVAAEPDADSETAGHAPARGIRPACGEDAVA